MKALIGTYRGLRYVPRLLDSIEEFVTGIDGFIFIDDSGSAETAAELRRLGEVVETGAQGYNAAMRAAVARGAQEQGPVIWLEEDFTFTAPVSFDTLAADLDAHPDWAQIVVQRAPYYDVEKQYGSIVNENRRRAKLFQKTGDYWEHTSFFSGNPSVWRKEVFEIGWPEGESSEFLMTRLLVRKGYKFALTDAILCEHDGEHLGIGY